MKAMPKKVALVGHCGADTSYLRMAIMTVSRDLQVLVAHDETSLQKALNDGIDLVLPNRILDWGFPEDDGVALIRRLSATHPRVKTMLISNFPDAQTAAVQAGGMQGFGKRQIGTPQATELLRRALDGASAGDQAAVSNDRSDRL